MGIQNPNIRPGLAVAVILLFIGVALAPSIKSDVTISTISLNEGNLSGYVNDTLMNPVQGARVRVYFHETYEEDYTDSSGYYHVTNIPICYCLKNATASKAGYTTEWVLLSIDENTTYDFVLTPLNGNTLYVGGDGPGNYTTIQEAIDNASNGDMVYVYDDSSPYYENVLVDKSIDLIGENRDTTVIDGGGSGDVVYVSADNVNVSGLTIQNSGTYPNSCIDIRSNMSVFVNNIIINPEGWGFDLRNSNYNSIYMNNIQNGRGIGIFLENSFHITISENILTNIDGDCIWLTKSSNNSIYDNIISENYHGIYLRDSENNSINENTVYNNVAGMYFSNSSDNNTILGNTIASNQYDGIYIHSSNGVISANTISSNGGKGIRFYSESNNNRLYHNNLINNTINAFDDGNNCWDSGYWSGGNYWSDYTGDDFYHGDEQDKLGQDWRGDTPYNISGGSNQDMYPLILPYESEPPFAVIEHPSDGLITSEHNVTIIGYITDNVGLVKSGTIYGSEWEGVTVWSESLPPYELTPKLDFDFIVELKPGWNEIGIHATDPSDNYGEDSVLVYYYPDIVYVDDDYNSSTQGWQQYCFNSIQDGVDAVAENGTVYVYSGIYNEVELQGEFLTVNKPIDIIGNGSDCTFLYHGVKVTHSDVNITRFTINGTWTYDHHIILSTGISLVNSDNNFIFDNVLYGFILGINLANSNNNYITDNLIKGIRLSHSNNNIIIENTINDSLIGIDLEDSYNNNILKNYISVRGEMTCIGLFLKNAFNNTIHENNFINNDCAFSIKNTSSGNKMHHNNFIDNTEIGSDEGFNTWNDTYPSGGNYWDGYMGEDKDGDGIGDTPYNIPGGDNQDRYPLMEPYGMTKLTFSTGAGLFKFSGIIKNIGNKTAFNVQWKITFDGGIILIGRESSGYLPRPLMAGEEMSVSSGIVIGFGRIVITVSVWADNAPLVSKSIPGFLFLFFIKIREGYRLTPMISTGVFV